MAIYVKVDGKYFGRWGCVIVFKERGNIIFWDFVLRENYFNYCLDFAKIKELGYKILGTTSDWHGGLISALKSLFPDIPHQRCLVHTQRFCQSLLTQHPETEAGIRLLEIVKFLNQIKNQNEKEIWIKWLLRFERRYLKVINERTYAEDKRHWWHTHKNLRRAFRTLRSSIDNLFLYLDFPDLSKDTNGLEAEFKHLEQKLSVHKGLTRKRKINFIKWYFFLKSAYQ
ncbi:transposase [Candidatus Gottesmanbacteria bacterium]|nr:transposase [Candidatus Gottesmanbacteria bacterium]